MANSVKMFQCLFHVCIVLYHECIVTLLLHCCYIVVTLLLLVVLVYAGARTDLKNQDGKTAFVLAKNPETAAILQQACTCDTVLGLLKII